LSIRKNFAARNLSPDENGGADLLDGNGVYAVYVSDHPAFFARYMRRAWQKPRDNPGISTRSDTGDA
jgi:hypothetical protein